MMNANRSWFVLCAFLFSAAVVQSEDQWYVLYDDALSAMQREDWNTAESKLTAALQLNPNEGRKVKAYGTRLINYIPSYHLGIVYYQLKQYDKALRSLQRAEKTRLIQPSDKEFSLLAKTKQAAMQALDTARTSLIPPQTKPSTPIAEKPKEEFVQSAPTPSPPDISVKPREDNMAREPDLKLKPPASDRVEEMHRAVSSALLKGDWNGARTLVDLLGRIQPDDRRIPSYRKKIAEAEKNVLTEEKISAGILSFLSGKYEDAAEKLKQVTLEQPQNGKVQFFLGCSLAALAYSDNSTQQRYLNEARKEFAAARQTGFQIKPLFRDLISPRILSLYQ